MGTVASYAVEEKRKPLKELNLGVGTARFNCESLQRTGERGRMSDIGWEGKPATAGRKKKEKTLRGTSGE